jgi:hypothetical protein
MCTLLTLVLSAASLTAFAGDEKAAMDPAAEQAMMAAMTPGEHHEHMKKLVGNFDYAIKMWMDPSAPPTESVG